MLIAWGEKDLYLPSAQARNVSRLVPGCRCEVFRGCGYAPQLECPERFNRIVE